jgi:hypothetical protein
MNRLRVPFVFAVLGLFLAACGSSSGGEGGGGAGGIAGLPAAPVLTTVMPMEAVLHVAWTTSTTCDFIDAERKDDQNTTYAAAWEVTGDLTSHMDGDAAANMNYSYRLRCKVGDKLSAYSNEMSGNPTTTSP